MAFCNFPTNLETAYVGSLFSNESERSACLLKWIIVFFMRNYRTLENMCPSYIHTRQLNYALLICKSKAQNKQPKNIM